jgi:hypothetical protein
MTVPAGITTGFGGGGGGSGAGVGAVAAGAVEESGGFKFAAGDPVASELCDGVVPSAADSDFLLQAMERESKATNKIVGFMQVIFFIISPFRI